MVKKKGTDPPNSPITVGGGGDKKPKRKVDPRLYVHFDHDDYAQVSGGYDSEILALAHVTLNGNSVGQVDERTRVEIKYKKTLTHKITINKDGKMGVKFNGRHFIRDYATERHNGRGQLKSLKVGNEEIPVPNPEEFVIMCHTRLKTPKGSKTLKKR